MFPFVVRDDIFGQLGRIAVNYPDVAVSEFEDTIRERVVSLVRFAEEDNESGFKAFACGKGIFFMIESVLWEDVLGEDITELVPFRDENELVVIALVNISAGIVGKVAEELVELLFIGGTPAAFEYEQVAALGRLFQKLF